MTPSNLTILTLKVKNLTDFALARNELLKSVKTDWVLFLDSDETLSPELNREISEITSNNNPSYDAYMLYRTDHFLGKVLQYGETGKIAFVRLARKNWGAWQGRVHEKWVGPGPVGQLSSPILHTPHPKLVDFVAKIDRYSTLAAQERFDQGKTSSLWHIAVYPIAKFKYNYLFKLGFLDGTVGVIHAFIMSWHSYLTWTKLYLLWQKK
jgi:glycosyltransferase involved in cell wall biosynthesis